MCASVPKSLLLSPPSSHGQVVLNKRYLKQVNIETVRRGGGSPSHNIVKGLNYCVHFVLSTLDFFFLSVFFLSFSKKTRKQSKRFDMQVDKNLGHC